MDERPTSRAGGSRGNAGGDAHSGLALDEPAASLPLGSEAFAAAAPEIAAHEAESDGGTPSAASPTAAAAPVSGSHDAPPEARSQGALPADAASEAAAEAESARPAAAVTGETDAAAGENGVPSSASSAPAETGGSATTFSAAWEKHEVLPARNGRKVRVDRKEERERGAASACARANVLKAHASFALSRDLAPHIARARIARSTRPSTAAPRGIRRTERLRELRVRAHLWRLRLARCSRGDSCSASAPADVDTLLS